MPSTAPSSSSSAHPGVGTAAPPSHGSPPPWRVFPRCATSRLKTVRADAWGARSASNSGRHWFSYARAESWGAWCGPPTRGRSSSSWQDSWSAHEPARIREVDGWRRIGADADRAGIAIAAAACRPASVAYWVALVPHASPPRADVSSGRQMTAASRPCRAAPVGAARTHRRCGRAVRRAAMHWRQPTLALPSVLK